MRRISLLLLLSTALVLPAQSSPLSRAGRFFYSSLCSEAESGDASGYRIKLIRTGKEDRLYLERSEGPLYGPMLATNLKIEAESGKISFTIPANTPPSDMPTAVSYSGTITAEWIKLEDDIVPRQRTPTSRYMSEVIGPRGRSPTVRGHRLPCRTKTRGKPT